MDDAIILQELETLAADLTIEVRYDALESRGGLCRYGGKTCLIVNSALSIPERVQLLSSALSRFPLDDVFLRPQVRQLLEGSNAL
jgi:hypothetical protein